MMDGAWKNNTMLSVWGELLQKLEEYTGIFVYHNTPPFF